MTKFRIVTPEQAAGKTPGLSDKDQAEADVRQATASELGLYRMLAVLKAKGIDLPNKIEDIKGRLNNKFQAKSDAVRASKSLAKLNYEGVEDDVAAWRFAIVTQVLTELEQQIVGTEATLEAAKTVELESGEDDVTGLDPTEFSNVQNVQIPGLTRQLARLNVEHDAVAKIYDALKPQVEAAETRRNEREVAEAQASAEKEAAELEATLEESLSSLRPNLSVVKNEEFTPVE